MSNIHAAAATLIHLHSSAGSSGWGDKIFGWVLHAAIWHIVGTIFRTFPILGTIGMMALAAGGVWFLVRWIRRRRARQLTPSARARA